MADPRPKSKVIVMIYFANPALQLESYNAEIRLAIDRVLDKRSFVLGNEVRALEAEFSEYIGCQHAIGVANGTDALELALRALEIGAGDEVITVSHTAVATVAAIEATGAKAKFVDIDSNFFTLDPSDLSSSLSQKTKAVIAVHLYGHPAPIKEISLFCKKHKLKLIEDVSQAHGAEWDGQKLGSFGDFGCFSCYPTKNLGALGDAGLITTNDGNLAKIVMQIREYGWVQRYISERPGRNSRLDEIQAAILRVKLKYLDKDNMRRRDIADTYNSLLREMPIKLPQLHKLAYHVFHLYVIRVKKRDQLMEHLKTENIFAGVHYPVPIHLQPAYRKNTSSGGALVVTETVSKEVLSLPIYPELSVFDLNSVVSSIHKFFDNGS